MIVNRDGKIIINKKHLDTLVPFRTEYEDYLEEYKDWQGTLEEFLDLKNISHEYKMWVFLCSFDSYTVGLIAADFAERALHFYEEKFPNDDRPRKAIEVARNLDINNTKSDIGSKEYSATANAFAAKAAYYASYAAAAASHCAVGLARGGEKQAQIEIMKRYAREQQ